MVTLIIANISENNKKTIEEIKKICKISKEIKVDAIEINFKDMNEYNDFLIDINGKSK